MQGNLINQLTYSRELIHYSLCNFVYYQNALMQKSELEVNLTLINRVIMVYELRTWTIGTHRSTGSFKIHF